MSPAGIVRTLGNFARSTPEKATVRQIKQNTDAIVGAIESCGFMFLTHPGDRAPVDLLKVAEACVRTGTLLEINANHMSLTPEAIKKLPKEAKFIVNSDAHIPQRVGDFASAIELITITELDPARVANLKQA
jgi:putative hydrolase